MFRTIQLLLVSWKFMMLFSTSNFAVHFLNNQHFCSNNGCSFRRLWRLGGVKEVRLCPILIIVPIRSSNFAFGFYELSTAALKLMFLFFLLCLLLMWHEHHIICGRFSGQQNPISVKGIWYQSHYLLALTRIWRQSAFSSIMFLGSSSPYLHHVFCTTQAKKACQSKLMNEGKELWGHTCMQKILTPKLLRSNNIISYFWCISFFI